MSLDRFAVIGSRQNADLETILHVDHPKGITA